MFYISVDIGDKGIADIVDISDNLITGVNDTGDIYK
jgi:hypothetical protein